MNRRSFLKWLGLGTVAGTAGFLAGCAVRTVNASVQKKKDEQPWRCSKCGLLLRSDDDMSDKRCPRCYTKQLKKITEVELEKYRSKEK